MRLRELRFLIDPDRRIRIVCEGNDIFEGLSDKGIVTFGRYVVREIIPIYDVLNQRTIFEIWTGKPPKIGRPSK